MKIKKLLALLLAVAMLAAFTAACAGNDDPAPPPVTTPTPTPTPAGTDDGHIHEEETDVPDWLNETGLPITKEPITVRAMLYNEPQNGRWEDLLIMQHIEEVTNIKWEYDVYETHEIMLDQMNLQFLAGTYAEVIMARGALSWGNWVHEEAFGDEGFLIDHKPLIARWMPHARDFLNEFTFLRAGQTASSGAMYGLPMYYPSGYGNNPHLWYMEPYFVHALDGWEDVPYTIEDMRTFLYDLKALLDSGEYTDPDPEMYVIGFRNEFGLGSITNVVLQAYTGALISPDNPWGVPDNQNVEFMIEHPGYRDALQFWVDMYRDEIVLPDLFTIDGAAFNAMRFENKFVTFLGSAGGINPDLIRERTLPGVEERGYWGCGSIRPMTSVHNDTARVGYETFGSTSYFAITDKCEYPEAVARWADLFFNRDFDITDNDVPNSFMLFRGFYGVHWEYTDFPENNYWTFLDRPDGTTQDDGNPLIDWTYSTAYLVPGWSIPVGVYYEMTFSQGDPRFVSKQLTNQTHQFPYLTTDTQFPPLARWLPEETDRAAVMLLDLQEYLRESWGLFMSGQVELNDDNWNNFVATCKSLGSEELTAIYQQVLNRWNVNLQG